MTSDVNCVRQESVFVFPIGMVRVKLIKSPSSIRIREQRSPSVEDWTKMYHNPLQAKWTGEASICWLLSHEIKQISLSEESIPNY